jgi:hypothetical protein
MDMETCVVNLQTKLAAALLGLGHISYEEARDKKLTAKQIISRHEVDHFPKRKCDGGPDEPWNLVWRLKEEHRRKTHQIDVPQIWKGKRIRKNWFRHLTKMANK